VVLPSLWRSPQPNYRRGITRRHEGAPAVTVTVATWNVENLFRPGSGDAVRPTGIPTPPKVTGRSKLATGRRLRPTQLLLEPPTSEICCADRGSRSKRPAGRRRRGPDRRGRCHRAVRRAVPRAAAGPGPHRRARRPAGFGTVPSDQVDGGGEHVVVVVESRRSSSSLYAVSSSQTKILSRPVSAAGRSIDRAGPGRRTR